MNTTKIESAIDILQKYISTVGIAYIHISDGFTTHIDDRFTIHSSETTLTISLSLQELNAILRSSYAARYVIEFHPKHVAIMIENEKNVNVVCEHIKQCVITQPFDIYTIKYVDNTQLTPFPRLYTHGTSLHLYTDALGKDYEMYFDVGPQKYSIRKVGVKYQEDQDVQHFDFLPEDKLKGYVCKFSEKGVLEAFINRVCDAADENCGKEITSLNADDRLLNNYNWPLTHTMIYQLNAIFRAKGFTESYVKRNVIYLRRSKHFCECMHCNPQNIPQNMWKHSEHSASNTLTDIYNQCNSVMGREFASRILGSHEDKLILAKKKVKSAVLKLDEVTMLRSKTEKKVNEVKANDTEIELNQKRKRLTWYTEQLEKAEKEKKEADDELTALMTVDPVEAKVESVDAKFESVKVEVEAVGAKIQQMLKDIDADLEKRNKELAAVVFSKTQLLNKIKEIKHKEKMSDDDRNILNMIPDARP